MATHPKGGTGTPARPPEEEPLGLRATKEALDALRQALGGGATGRGLRVWVEPGIRPQVRMMLDRPSPSDETIRLGELLVFVDPQSRRFLRDAEIQVVRAGGQAGFRVVGPHVPSGPPEPSSPGPDSPGSEGRPDRKRIEERIRGALKQIFDPEIPMNLVDLGLIYGIDWTSDRSLTLRMTLTSPGCPATEAIAEEVDRAVRAASGLPEVKVELVWDPPWTPDRMSPLARRQLEV